LQCQTFSIHKHLLQKVTQYLNKLLTSKDGQKGVIVLKDEDAETFEMFYDWLYTVIPPLSM
jgi:hypothetical protein